MLYQPGQFYMPFLLLDKTTGDSLTGEGANITIDVTVNGNALASGIGAITELGDGAYQYACPGDENLGGNGAVRIKHPDSLTQFIDFQSFPLVQFIASVGTVAVDGDINLQAALALILAATTGLSSGGGTGERRFRDHADTKDRIIATIDANNNRTAISYDDEN